MKFLVAVALICGSLVAQAEVIDVSNEELQQLMAQGVQLVDLRTAGEWQQTGVVAGSHMLTLFDERGRAHPEWSKAVAAVSAAEQPIALICRTGNRTRVAARMLSEASPTRKVYNVRSGITAWVKAGQPVIPFQQNLKTAGVRCAPVC